MTTLIPHPEIKISNPEVQQFGPEEVMNATNNSIVRDGNAVTIFEVPKTEEYMRSKPDLVAVSNPSGFQRVLDEGISGLEDGEVVSFTVLDKIGDKLSQRYSYTLTRHDGSFNVDYDDSPRYKDNLPEYEDVVSKTTDETTKENIKSQKLPKKLVGFSEQGISVSVADRGLGLAERGDKLGDVVREIGFVSDDRSAEVPMPSSLTENIARLKSKGLNIPNVRFFNDSVIDGEDYLQSWADGLFPASEHPAYFAHDILTEHFQPLIIFREDAMGIATLYARAVLELPEISAELPKDNYQINTKSPEMIEVVMSGRDKVDHAALCLDNFTTELSAITRSIDSHESDEDISRDFSEFPEHFWRYMPQMVRTILNSSHKDELITYLDSVGSQSYDSETKVFSFETYTREMFRRAQDYWAIEPEPKVAKTIDEVVNDENQF